MGGRTTGCADAAVPARRVVAVVAVLAVAVGAVLATAAHADARHPGIARGVQLYEDLEYEQAIRVLSEALLAPGLTREDRVEGEKHLAFSQLALGRDDAAREAFRRLLLVEPDFALADTESPRAIDLLGEARRAPDRRPRPAASLPLGARASPATPRPGAAVTLEVTAGGAGAEPARVVVHHRLRGQRAYSTTMAERSGPRRFTAVVPGVFVDAPGVEHYLVAEDTAGAPLGGLGTEQAPLFLPVAARTAGTPVYKRWWFWAGAGGAVAAAILLVSVLGADGGERDATVTVVSD